MKGRRTNGGNEPDQAVERELMGSRRAQFQTPNLDFIGKYLCRILRKCGSWWLIEFFCRRRRRPTHASNKALQQRRHRMMVCKIAPLWCLWQCGGADSWRCWPWHYIVGFSVQSENYDIRDWAKRSHGFHWLYFPFKCKFKPRINT